ncbi:di-heme oxidoredictase family protein [Thermus composti]|uniref:Di-heme oxidoredictase family protein n=1 Tax=Thermus composti TaxID=532059 RepID=A0ABV6PYP4_9DEIN
MGGDASSPGRTAAFLQPDGGEGEPGGGELFCTVQGEGQGHDPTNLGRTSPKGWRKRWPPPRRTPPLWGIGLTRKVLGEEVYLHDGRAKSLEEAILWHGGRPKGPSAASWPSPRRTGKLSRASEPGQGARA